MKQEMILTTEKLVFVTDPDESDKNIENLVTEFNTNLYRIKIDRTLKPPYYELFHEWKEGRRVLPRGRKDQSIFSLFTGMK